MSVIRYPPLSAPAPGQMRGGAHTDFGSLTIVPRDQAPGGLQVLVDGTWINAPHVDDSFVVNLGDLMAEWTNDRWVIHEESAHLITKRSMRILLPVTFTKR